MSRTTTTIANGMMSPQAMPVSVEAAERRHNRERKYMALHRRHWPGGRYFGTPSRTTAMVTARAIEYTGPLTSQSVKDSGFSRTCHQRLFALSFLSRKDGV